MKKTYYCDYCEYDAKTNTNLHIHKRSKKHTDNVFKKENSEINILKKKETEYKDLLIKNSFEIEQLNKKIKELEIELEKRSNTINNNKSIISRLKNDIDKLKNDKFELVVQHKDEQKEVLTKIIDNKNSNTTSNNDNKSNISALTYANKNFTDAPSLEKINNFNINNYDCSKQDEKEKMIDLIINSYESNSLHKLLGDHIIKYYKKDKTHDQSFHTTDSSRLNYIVRELIENVGKWIQDNNGLIISTKIIQPLIVKCVEMLLEYQKKLTFDLSVCQDFSNIDKRIYAILNIISSIDKGKLEEDVHKYIAPFFLMNKLLK